METLLKPNETFNFYDSNFHEFNTVELALILNSSLSDLELKTSFVKLACQLCLAKVVAASLPQAQKHCPPAGSSALQYL